MVHLSGFDSNKYQSILRLKKRIAEYDRDIDEFGELAVGKIRRQQKRLMPDEIQALISEYLSGKEPPELGKKFGIHRITASKILKRNGVVIRNTCNRKT